MEFLLGFAEYETSALEPAGADAEEADALDVSLRGKSHAIGCAENETSPPEPDSEKYGSAYQAYDRL